MQEKLLFCTLGHHRRRHATQNIWLHTYIDAVCVVYIVTVQMGISHNI